MKRSVILFILLFSFVGAQPQQAVLAVDNSVRQEAFEQLGAVAGSGGAQLGNPTDPRAIAARAIRIGLGLIGTIFLVLTLYAGFLWMTAGGNDEQVSKARRLIFDSAIGLAVVLAAYSITIFVSRFLLSSTSGSDQSVPGAPNYCVENPLDPNCAG